MKRFFLTIAIITLVFIVSSSCKKEGKCYCYTDVQGYKWVVDSLTTKQECKKESKRRQSFTGDYCKWE